MTTIMQLADVGPLGELLGSGGQAEVFALPRRPGEVLKRYLHGLTLDPSAIDRLITVRTSLSPSDRLALDRAATWPLARVMDGRRFVGVTLPRLEEEFFALLRFGNAHRRHAREFQYLLRRDACDRYGIRHPPLRDRWLLAQRLTEIADVFDRAGLVYGDHSETNILWSMTRVKLIDCDNARLDGHRGVTPGVQTLDWSDPLLSGSEPDRLADRYKLCLAVHRMLALDTRAHPTESRVRAFHDRLSPELADRLVAGLFGSRTERPRASILLDTLGRIPNQTAMAAATHSPAPARPQVGDRPRITVGPTATKAGLPPVKGTPASPQRPRIAVGGGTVNTLPPTVTSNGPRFAPGPVGIAATVVVVLIIVLAILGMN